MHLCTSQESKLFLSLLSFVLGSKEMDSWCSSTCLFSIQHDENPGNRKQFPCVYLAEVNIAIFLLMIRVTLMALSIENTEYIDLLVSLLHIQIKHLQ